MNASQVVISTDVLNDGIDAIWMTCQHVLWGVQGINFSPEQSRGNALVFTVNNESWCLKKKEEEGRFPSFLGTNLDHKSEGIVPEEE